MSPSGSCTYLACKGLKSQVSVEHLSPPAWGCLLLLSCFLQDSPGGLITKALLVPPQGGLLMATGSTLPTRKGLYGALASVTTGSEGRAEVG